MSSSFKNKLLLRIWLPFGLYLANLTLNCLLYSVVFMCICRSSFMCAGRLSRHPMVVKPIHDKPSEKSRWKDGWLSQFLYLTISTCWPHQNNDSEEVFCRILNCFYPNIDSKNTDFVLVTADWYMDLVGIRVEGIPILIKRQHHVIIWNKRKEFRWIVEESWALGRCSGLVSKLRRFVSVFSVAKIVAK